MLERVCRKGNLPLHCLWECKLVQVLWRTEWRFLKKLKADMPYDLPIPLLGIYPEKSLIWEDTCTPMFKAALFTTAKTWKQSKCPSTEKWLKNMWYTYMCVYIYIYIYIYVYTHTYTHHKFTCIHTQTQRNITQP